VLWYNDRKIYLVVLCGRAPAYSPGTRVPPCALAQARGQLATPWPGGVRAPGRTSADSDSESWASESMAPGPSLRHWHFDSEPVRLLSNTRVQTLRRKLLVPSVRHGTSGCTMGPGQGTSGLLASGHLRLDPARRVPRDCPCGPCQWAPSRVAFWVENAFIDQNGPKTELADGRPRAHWGSPKLDLLYTCTT
jgi:hypothetical protein